jgi:hypothetical protein
MLPVTSFVRYEAWFTLHYYWFINSNVLNPALSYQRSVDLEYIPNWSNHECLVSYCKFTWFLIRDPFLSADIWTLFLSSCVTLKLLSAASYRRHRNIEKQGFYYSI